VLTPSLRAKRRLLCGAPICWFGSGLFGVGQFSIVRGTETIVSYLEACARSTEQGDMRELEARTYTLTIWNILGIGKTNVEETSLLIAHSVVEVGDDAPLH
jgi:hypothetical protein